MNHGKAALRSRPAERTLGPRRRAAGAALRALATLATLSCGAPSDRGAGAARDATLRALFLAHERPRVLVVWADADAGPVFAELAATTADAVPARDAPPAAVGAVPVVAVRRRDLDTLFRAHPDGWKAFWARYPGSTGVIELSPVRLTGDSAALVVGRSCGEHCRTAWRVRLGRAGAGWRVARVEFLPVPHT